jgi:hypothetical protein
MLSISNRTRFCALLLAIIFLGAQFHFCADLNSVASSSHMCPLCSAASSAVAPALPVIAVVPVMNRLEILAVISLVSTAIPRALSPRAPPAL